MKLSEYMRQAIGFVKQGWCQGKLTDECGSVCARGAINQALYGRPYWAAESIFGDPQWDALDAEIARAAQAWGHSDTVRFNNHPDTTQADVIACMEKAAAHLEERGK